MMKKLLFTTLTLMLLTAMQVMAQGRGLASSELNMQLFDGALFIMDVNGQKFRPAENFKSVAGIAPGRTYLKVVRVDDIIRPNGYAQRVRTRVFEGFVRIPPGSRVHAKINRNGRFAIMSQVPFGGGACGPVASGPVGFNGGHANLNTPVAACGHNGCGASCSHVVVNQNCMSAHVFGQLQATLANTTFESNRLSIARQYISTQGVSSNQVLALMNQFTFESSRLELAKFAYGYTIDPQNYFIVNNGLTYGSSIDELNTFLTYGY